jgi:hypothetical protein
LLLLLLQLLLLLLLLQLLLPLLHKVQVLLVLATGWHQRHPNGHHVGGVG